MSWTENHPVIKESKKLSDGSLLMYEDDGKAKDIFVFTDNEVAVHITIRGEKQLTKEGMQKLAEMVHYLLNNDINFDKKFP